MSVFAAAGPLLLAVFLYLYRHSFPLYYHFWMGYKSIMGLKEGRFSRLDEAVVHRWKVDLSDIDINMHMNNARYNQYSDYGRYTWCTRFFGSRAAMAKYRVANGGVVMSFLQEIKPFSDFVVTTRLLGYDQKWVFITHEFTSPAGKIYAAGMSKLVFKEGRKTVPPAEMFQHLSYDPSTIEPVNAPGLSYLQCQEKLTEFVSSKL